MIGKWLAKLADVIVPALCQTHGKMGLRSSIAKDTKCHVLPHEIEEADTDTHRLGSRVACFIYFLRFLLRMTFWALQVFSKFPTGSFSTTADLLARTTYYVNFHGRKVSRKLCCRHYNPQVSSLPLTRPLS